MTRISFEKRIKASEAFINDARETLSKEKVVSALGSYAPVLTSLIDDLYIPDRRDGVYVAQQDGKSVEGIPFIVAQAGESTRFHTRSFSRLHPLQRKNLKHFLEQKTQSTYTDQDIDNYVRTIESNLPDDIDEITVEDETMGVLGYTDSIYGFMDRNEHGLRLNEHLYINTRPYVLMYAGYEPDHGLTLLHELVHVHQLMKTVEKPMKQQDYEDELLVSEFEARYVEHAIFHALGVRQGRADKFTAKIERIRAMAHGHDGAAFENLPRMRQLLASFAISEDFYYHTRNPRVNIKKRNKHSRVGVKRR